MTEEKGMEMSCDRGERHEDVMRQRREAWRCHVTGERHGDIM